MRDVQTLVSFDMRAPEWGTPTNELYRAAIDMAKIQLLFGKDPQMRRLAQEIITDQQF